MRKIAAVRKTDWATFTASIPDELRAWETRESGQFPNWVLVTIRCEGTWQLAKASGLFLTMPAPWCSASRIPAGVQSAVGQPVIAGETIGDYLERLLGRDIFFD